MKKDNKNITKLLREFKSVKPDKKYIKYTKNVLIPELVGKNRLLPNSLRPAKFALLTIAVLLLLFTPIGIASSKSSPGELLHPIKKIIKKVNNRKSVNTAGLQIPTPTPTDSQQVENNKSVQTPKAEAEDENTISNEVKVSLTPTSVPTQIPTAVKTEEQSKEEEVLSATREAKPTSKTDQRGGDKKNPSGNNKPSSTPSEPTHSPDVDEAKSFPDLPIDKIPIEVQEKLKLNTKVRF